MNYTQRLAELKEQDFLNKKDSNKSFKELKEQVNKEVLEELEQTLGKDVEEVEMFRNNIINNIKSIDRDTLIKMRKAISKSENLGDVDAEMIWLSLEFKIGKVL